MKKLLGIVALTVVVALPMSACQFAGGPVFNENTEHKVHFGKPTTSNEPLVVKVKKALRTYPTTASLFIEVNLQSEGIVRLTGNVSTELERGDAEKVASGVEGVKFVANALFVN